MTTGLLKENMLFCAVCAALAIAAALSIISFYA